MRSIQVGKHYVTTLSASLLTLARVPVCACRECAYADGAGSSFCYRAPTFRQAASVEELPFEATFTLRNALRAFDPYSLLLGRRGAPVRSTRGCVASSCARSVVVVPIQHAHTLCHRGYSKTEIIPEKLVV